MTLSSQLAQHIREAQYGPNMTGANLRENLADVTLQEATTQVHNLNTIASLTFHIHYYLAAQLNVLEGGPLDAHDKYSYDAPEFKTEEDWRAFIQQTVEDADRHAHLVEQMTDDQIWETFVLEKYQTYFRNFLGMIEHTYYHLGQIAIIKKMIRQG